MGVTDHGALAEARRYSPLTSIISIRCRNAMVAGRARNAGLQSRHVLVRCEVLFWDAIGPVSDFGTTAVRTSSDQSWFEWDGYAQASTGGRISGEGRLPSRSAAGAIPWPACSAVVRVVWHL